MLNWALSSTRISAEVHGGWGMQVDDSDVQLWKVCIRNGRTWAIAARRLFLKSPPSSELR